MYPFTVRTVWPGYAGADMPAPDTCAPALPSVKPRV